MKKIIVSLTIVSAMVANGNVFAQDQTTSIPAASPVVKTEKHPMSVHNRLVRQQRRIDQGIKSGELTRAEAKNLERHEANIATDAKIDRAENGGKLTPAERRNLERRLNRQSKRIYREKHD